MNKIPVIIDCDPGTDDTMALMLANKIENFDLLAVTTVAGNAICDYTFQNARNVLSYIGAEHVPVYKGAARPMMRELKTAPHVHGVDGLAGVEIPQSNAPVETEAAWDAIYRIAKEQNGELVLIAVGPMTNVALALTKYNDLPKYIKRIVIMGGAAIGGNVTPAAEFNIYVDPEAAELMFTSGIPIVMCGLDVTMKAYLTEAEIERIGSMGSKEAKLFHDVEQRALGFYRTLGMNYVAAHDPTAVLFAADDSIFTGEEAGVHVETKGKLTLGKTVTDLYSDAQFDDHFVFIVTDVDRDAFVKKVTQLMESYS